MKVYKSENYVNFNLGVDKGARIRMWVSLQTGTRTIGKCKTILFMLVCIIKHPLGKNIWDWTLNYVNMDSHSFICGRGTWARKHKDQERQNKESFYFVCKLNIPNWIYAWLIPYFNSKFCISISTGCVVQVWVSANDWHHVCDVHLSCHMTQTCHK